MMASFKQNSAVFDCFEMPDRIRDNWPVDNWPVGQLAGDFLGGRTIDR